MFRARKCVPWCNRHLEAGAMKQRLKNAARLERQRRRMAALRNRIRQSPKWHAAEKAKEAARKRAERARAATQLRKALKEQDNCEGACERRRLRCKRCGQSICVVWRQCEQGTPSCYSAEVQGTLDLLAEVQNWRAWFRALSGRVRISLSVNGHLNMRIPLHMREAR